MMIRRNGNSNVIIGRIATMLFFCMIGIHVIDAWTINVPVSKGISSQTGVLRTTATTTRRRVTPLMSLSSSPSSSSSSPGNNRVRSLSSTSHNAVAVGMETSSSSSPSSSVGSRAKQAVFGGLQQKLSSSRRKSKEETIPPAVLEMKTVYELEQLVGITNLQQRRQRRLPDQEQQSGDSPLSSSGTSPTLQTDSDTSLVAVMFHAPFCKACQAAKPHFDRMAKKYVQKQQQSQQQEQHYHHQHHQQQRIQFVSIPLTNENEEELKNLGILKFPFGHIYHSQIGLLEELPMLKKLLPTFEERLQQYIFSSSISSN